MTNKALPPEVAQYLKELNERKATDFFIAQYSEQNRAALVVPPLPMPWRDVAEFVVSAAESWNKRVSAPNMTVYTSPFAEPVQQSGPSHQFLGLREGRRAELITYYIGNEFRWPKARKAIRAIIGPEADSPHYSPFLWPQVAKPQREILSAEAVFAGLARSLYDGVTQQHMLDAGKALLDNNIPPKPAVKNPALQATP